MAKVTSGFQQNVADQQRPGSDSAKVEANCSNGISRNIKVRPLTASLPLCRLLILLARGGNFLTSSRKTHLNNVDK